MVDVMLRHAILVHMTLLHRRLMRIDTEHVNESAADIAIADRSNGGLKARAGVPSR